MTFNIIEDKKVFCCYCGRWIVPPLQETAEHLIPISKGGNNTSANKRRCCNRCNSWRGNSSLEYFKNDVQYHLNNNIIKAGFSKLDLETMIENIDYVKHYIETSNGRLLRNSVVS